MFNNRYLPKEKGDDQMEVLELKEIPEEKMVELRAGVLKVSSLNDWKTKLSMASALNLPGNITSIPLRIYYDPLIPPPICVCTCLCMCSISHRQVYGRLVQTLQGHSPHLRDTSKGTQGENSVFRS